MQHHESQRLSTSFPLFISLFLFSGLCCSYLTVSDPQTWSCAAAEVAKANEWNLSCKLTGNSYITLFYYATCFQFDLLQDVHAWLFSLRLQKKHHKKTKNRLRWSHWQQLFFPRKLFICLLCLAVKRSQVLLIRFKVVFIFHIWSLLPLCQKIKADVSNAIKHFHQNLVWVLGCGQMGSCLWFDTQPLAVTLLARTTVLTSARSLIYLSVEE